jgi:ATP-binding cassette subfamily F protein uup
MAAPLILTIQNAFVTFGGKPVFEDLSLNIHAGDKICLIGKNGSGKTTLMNLLAGTHEMDFGKRWQLLGSQMGYLTQDVKFAPGQTVFDFIFSGLSKPLPELEYLVTQVAEPLGIDIQEKMGNLSGGQLRRAALAYALVSSPDILMLDEPTNHMDFEAVEYLENYLKAYRGTLILISHDRTFLRNISNKVFWLDRGQIRICPKGYGYFETWSQDILEQERRELENREKMLAYEAEWANRGISARRKRNVKRLEDFKFEREKLKADASLFRQTMQKLEMEPLSVEMSSKLVAEFIKVSKSFNE